MSSYHVVFIILFYSNNDNGDDNIYPNRLDLRTNGSLTLGGGKYALLQNFLYTNLTGHDQTAKLLAALDRMQKTVHASVSGSRVWLADGIVIYLAGAVTGENGMDKLRILPCFRDT